MPLRTVIPCFVVPLLLVCLLAATAHAQTTPVTGAWNNHFFGSTGPITGTANLTLPTFSLELHFGGFVFGELPGEDGFHPPITLTGSVLLDGSMIVDPINNHPLFGDLLDGVADADGNLTATLTDVPNPNIDTVDLFGTVSEDLGLNLTYQVNFIPAADPGEPVTGSILVAPVPEPATATALLLPLAATLALRRKHSHP